MKPASAGFFVLCKKEMAIFPHGSAGEACRREPRFATARFAHYALTSLRLTKEMKSKNEHRGFLGGAPRPQSREGSGKGG